MLVREIMTPYPAYIRMGADIRRAAEIISVSEVSHLMVLDHDDTFVGALSEDDVLTAVLEAGAEEVNDLGEAFEVISEATDAHAVRVALEAASIPVESADVSFLPSVSVPQDDDTGRKVLRHVDALEDSDDVQNVWANFDVSDELLESV